MDDGFPMNDAETLLARVDWTRRLAARLVRARGDGDDVAQAALLEAWRTWGPLGPTPLAWLRSVVRHAAGRLARRDDLRREVEARGGRRAAHAARSAADLVAAAELHRRLADAVLALGEPARSTVLRRYFDDASFEEIAVADGVPASTVRARHRRALVELRARLAGDDPRRAALVAVGLAGGALRRLEGLASVIPKARGDGSGAFAPGAVVMSVKVKVVAAVLVASAAAWFFAASRDGSASGASAGGAGHPAVVADRKRPAHDAETVEGPPLVRRSAFDDAAPGRLVWGEVADIDGSPVRGATVAVYPAKPGFRPTLRDGVFLEAAAVGVTDAAGAFRLRVDPAFEDVLVAAVAQGLRPAAIAAGATSPARLELGRDAVVRGTVMDVRERPVPHAKIRETADVDGVHVVTETTADAEGRYEMTTKRPDVSSAFRGVVEVEAPGFAVLEAASFGARPGASDAVKDFYLVRGFTLRGRVTDATTGAPAPEARVVVWTVRRTSAPEPAAFGAAVHEGEALRILRETRSDSDGRFSFDALPAWGVESTSNGLERDLGGVIAFKEGFVAGETTLAVGDDGAVVDVTCLLRRPGTIRGRVVDKEGLPLENAAVGWRAPARLPPKAWKVEENIAPFTRSDAEGRYTLRNVPIPAPGESRASVGAWGAAFPCVDPAPRADVDFAAGPEAVAPDLVLTPDLAQTAVLTVLGVDGAPASALLRGPGSGATTTTDASGRGVVRLQTALGPAGRRVQVAAEGAATERVDIPPSAEPVHVTVRLRPGRTVRGRVLRADGQPAHGCRITASDPAAEKGLTPPPWSIDRRGLLQLWGASVDAYADGEGRFALKGLERAPVRLDVAATSDATEEALTRIVDVDESEIRIVLPHASPPPAVAGADVEVHVKWRSDGSPVLRAWLHMRKDRGSQIARPTGPGRFVFKTMPFGDRTIFVTGGDAAVAPEPV
ncbi:MAG TPA: sigma factor-like helix-turn-helix DNA-binding protein, partial [Planctomycetota bacterium]|nr:sigma factor-like helix-turn-helix DNA-binding protein [Planctomycetota bacterium]